MSRIHGLGKPLDTSEETQLPFLERCLLYDYTPGPSVSRDINAPDRQSRVETLEADNPFVKCL